MALQDIPEIGDNSYTDGFLSKAWTLPVIQRLNLWNKIEVKTGAGMGNAPVLVSPENVVIDLTKFGLGTLDIWAVANGGPAELTFMAKVKT